jgi:hypothetical protein
MNSTLPSRWHEILRQQAADNVGTVLAQARRQPEPRRVPRWAVPVAAVAFGTFSLASLLGSTPATGRGGVPFDRGTVISTRTAGLGANAEDLAPPRKQPQPIAASDPMLVSVAEPSVPKKPAQAPVRPRPLPTPSPLCLDCEKRQLAASRPVEEPIEHAQPLAPVVPEKPAPIVINVGTRMEAVLAEPVITGAALAPAAARLVADFFVGDQLAIAAGTPLVGEGFATNQDDRVQVVFTAFVRDGKTVQLEAWALQNSEMGIKGKILRKGSKGKKGAGAVLGAAASALSFGLAGAAPGPGGAALASLGSTASSDLNTLGRNLRWSDKSVRVEAGVPITVYVRRDLKIE